MAVCYRSDWPEVGLLAALSDRPYGRSKTSVPDNTDWVRATEIPEGGIRWVASQAELETNLYGFPIWNLHLEVTSTLPFNISSIQDFVVQTTRQLLETSPWGTAYVCSKLIEGEPLYFALREVGFEEIERRRIYRCKMRDIPDGSISFQDTHIQFVSLADIGSEHLSDYREQILDVCREAFEEEGHSRYFVDVILTEQQPGLTYILAMMKLNFSRLALENFLIAIDTRHNYVCGFTVYGKKHGFVGDLYTQLLSAVRKAYRSQEIYRRLTYLLSQILSPKATLLNVTHTNNHAIQRAYHRSGRKHLVDTVVLRRFYNNESCKKNTT
jgi:ribosomal protein S18 acetylase RimI-like enzyme